MALVIKVGGVEAPSGAEKLYRDALVVPGTLVAYDFSNTGTLNDFSLAQGAPLHDLARESSIPMGVDNSSTMYHKAEVNPQLTDGKGFRGNNLGSNPQPVEILGFNLGMGLLEYLHQNQPNTLMIVWIRQEGAMAAQPINSMASGGGGTDYPIRVNLSGGTALNVTLAGGAGGPISFGGGLLQYAVEYRGNGQPLRRYINGQYEGDGQDAFSFGEPTRELMLGQDGTTPPTAVTYRWLMEDLDVSGRDAEDVVKQDWEYCNGIGQYAGKPTKRPFIDNV